MTKYRTGIIVPLLAAVLLTGTAGVGRADDIADSARKVIEANKDAIVTVEVVVEMKRSYGSDSDKEEAKSTATGVVLDPSGLVVTSLLSVNPAEAMTDSGSPAGYQLSSRVIDAKLKMADGTEVPTDVVLRDRDLDMIFLRPKKPAEQPFKCVDLAQSSAPGILEPILALTRLGQVGNRSISASLDRVSAVLNKPRLCYVLSGISGYSLGSPVFTMDGKLVGINFMRLNPSKDNSSALSSQSDKVLPITLPCSTIQSAAAQAKTAKPEKMGEEPKVNKPTDRPAPKPAIKPTTKPPAKPAK